MTTQLRCFACAARIGRRTRRAIYLEGAKAAITRPVSLICPECGREGYYYVHEPTLTPANTQPTIERPDALPLEPRPGI